MSLNSETQQCQSLPIIRKQKQARILLIGGEPDTRHQVSFLLDSQGYEVVFASTVGEACSLIQNKRFAFVLFDWFLDGATGMGFCKAMRAIDNHTPAFFYTSITQGNGLKTLIAADAQQYAVQSVDTNAVLNAIFLHLEKSRNQTR
jgi:DNA-binding response OmpR family regulator